MKPREARGLNQQDLFRMELLNIIDVRHEWVRLAKVIDWNGLNRELGEYYADATCGQPPLPTRLLAGLHYIKHARGLSDEAVVAQYLENPYVQHFCGEQYFQHEFPCHPSSLSRWRSRVGEAGMEVLLQATIEAAKRLKAVNPSSFERVILDTTVMEKAVAYPTDSRLLEKARERLVVAAERAGIALRQNYNRVGPRLARQVGRYAHAKQYRRMRRGIKQQRTWVGRIVRDIERKHDGVSAPSSLKTLVERVRRLLAQRPKDKHKLYALHAPEVECVSKGKARTPYEFGVKVGIAVTAREGLVVGCRSLPGNPYDGHTISTVIEQAEILTDCTIRQAWADKGYRGNDDVPAHVTMHRPGRRKQSRTARRAMNRRSMIEAVIGHMKNEGRHLARNWLKGAMGDAINAVLAGVGQNIRLLLAFLRAFYAWLTAALKELVGLSPPSAVTVG